MRKFKTKEGLIRDTDDFCIITGKVAYTSQREASVNATGSTTPYLCIHCDMWHNRTVKGESK